jgi:hypothetical protein
MSSCSVSRWLERPTRALESEDPGAKPVTGKLLEPVFSNSSRQELDEASGRASEILDQFRDFEVDGTPCRIFRSRDEA